MEGYADFGALKTWYRVEGDLDSEELPLVLVHGGPGYTHDYLETFVSLADNGRAVIFYDQIGNGLSSPGPIGDRAFWTMDTLVDELQNLAGHLQLRRYVILGHSIGAGIAAALASQQPEGLRGLVLANGYASSKDLLEGLWTLRRALPQEVQSALAAHEAKGQLDHPDYAVAMGHFFKRHVCRLSVWPEPLLRSTAAMAANPNVFTTMYGPSLFVMSGTLADWSIADQLPTIEVPVLVYRGGFDEVVPACTDTLMARLPGARLRTFAQSSHVPHLEEPSACLAEVNAFLADIGRGAADWS
jgi:L-proline amide hydrolase